MASVKPITQIPIRSLKVLPPEVQPPSTAKKEASCQKGIPWTTFIKDEFSKVVEEISPRYEEDFRAFFDTHDEFAGVDDTSGGYSYLRWDFMKARVLFEALREGGLWGFRYVMPKVQVVKRSPALLNALNQAASQDGALTRKYLFFGDCDDVDFLYADLAAMIGLKVQVKLVQDNHVNVFVKIGKAWMRMDPSGISDFWAAEINYPTWDLPQNDYRPKGKIPEDYARRVLKPRNRSYAKGQAFYAKRIKGLKLDLGAARTLIARMRGIKEPPQPSVFRIPAQWRPAACHSASKK